MRRLIDIGSNLLDTQFQGVYNGGVKHAPDLTQVIARAADCGVERIIVTAGCLQESKEALQLARTSPSLFSTVGVHPTRCNELAPDAAKHIAALRDVLDEGVQCNKLAGFEAQFDLCEYSGLPAFFHHRACGPEFIEVLQRQQHRLKGGGVVHSFDGTLEEAQALIDAGLYIGLNGCSLKTDKNLEVIKALQIDKILLETDAPWCEIRPSHAGSKHVRTRWDTVKREKHQAVKGVTVKGRQEPCHMHQVLEVVAAVKGVDEDHLADIVYTNTMKLFFPAEAVAAADS
ncbi:hypothetical protein JKP88DRAFT_271771 [Tribonema minus]|uniref:Uncharacterized protein n=1 Tax=Tribonema minus TaxID=303371 RepID=A0A835ZA83_9STRA|nr:hypothetical protein JKP88DRAFT_271771 [Tribonema minus]